jgi:hypothetical protein
MSKKKASAKKAPPKKKAAKKRAVKRPAKKRLPEKKAPKKKGKAVKEALRKKPTASARPKPPRQVAKAPAPTPAASSPPLGNYRFDIDKWLPRFPLEERYERYCGEIITSPWDICQNEQLRREVQNEFDWGPAVPVDIFIMAQGEPADRHVTKIGGLPYRPAAASWPTRSDGDPMRFLVQFNFNDSRDLTGKLPGDVLLVFQAGDEMPFMLHFEWQPLGLSELISPDHVPEQANAFDPCYGHIYRTVSFPKAARRNTSSKYPQCRGKDLWSAYLLTQYQAMQIGKAPFFIQAGKEQLPGRLLCTFSSVQPDQRHPFPWINHPEQLMPEGDFRYDSNYLMIADMGCIYISIDDKGQLQTLDMCY